MSQRTIVEINHDYAHRIGGGAEGNIADELNRALSSGEKEQWKNLERYGIRRIVQCHHSDDRAAVVNGHTYKIG